MTQIFISYATSDRALVEERINPVLTESQFEPWIDHGAIVGGEEYMSRILQGLKECPWYLIALTPQSERSEFVKDELHWAMSHRSGRIIPVMLDECDPYAFHMRLPRLQYVDFTSGGPEAAVALRKVLELARESDAQEQRIDISQVQAPRDDTIELVAVVLTLLARAEQKHLRNLSAAGEVRYKGRRSLRHELRHLCEIGALERREGRQIGELTDGVDHNLAEIVRLTPVGELLAGNVR